jgi:hypothetical protein
MKIITSLLILSCGLPFASTAQKTAVLINAQDYRFIAQTAIPMGGPSKHLTGGYDFTVSKDSVVAYLPYYGRAYSAPIDPTKGGVQFTSTQFDYKVDTTKKGGWEISIKPRDNRDVNQIYLSVSSAGYASLRVTSINRQAISYNGEIVKRRRTHK